MTDTIRVWTRKELEDAAEIEPEGLVMLRLAITPKALLAVVEWSESKGNRIEMVSAYGDPLNCELRFYRRDVE